MPRMPRRLLVILMLVLATAACAPKSRKAPIAPASQTAKSAPPARQTPQQTPAPAQAISQNTPVQPAFSAPVVLSGEAAPAVTGPPAGFGGLSWGVSANSKPGLAVYETNAAAQVTTCIWPQGPKAIEGAPVREAFYEFYQDQFYHVWINFDGMAAYKAALAGLTRTYGPPTTENLEKYYHAWTIGDVNIYCAYHASENEGDVSYFYQPLYERMMAAHKAGPAKTAARSAKP